MKKYLYLMTLIILTALITGCHSANDDDENKVYTSIYPIQYIVEEIGGDLVSAESIYPPGVDAHSYEPSSRDMTQIAKSSAFFYLGAGMESFTESAASSLENQDVHLVEIADLDSSLFSRESAHHHDEHHNQHDQHNHNLHHHESHDHGDVDPHIWFDPLRMIQMGELIKEELNDVFPEHRKSFEANFQKFTEKMTQLDKDFSETLDAKEHKKILVAHAAYGYWEERYGIEQLAISGLSTNDEPSQKDLTELMNMAEKYDLNYVIFEQTGTDKVANIIKDQLDAEPLYMHNLESITEDDIENNETYITLMKKNLDTLDQATE